MGVSSPGSDCDDFETSQGVALETDQLRDSGPTLVFLPFKATQVRRGHGEAAVVEELRDLLDRLSCVPSELRSAVAEEVDASESVSYTHLTLPTKA